MKSTITSKGQITVPIEVRRRLGLREGDQVEFVFEESQTVIRPVIREDGDPFAKWVGYAPAFRNAAEVNAFVRDLREDDD